MSELIKLYSLNMCNQLYLSKAVKTENYYINITFKEYTLGLPGIDSSVNILANCINNKTIKTAT